MKFVKKLLIYFFGNVFNKLIVFLLLPIYTRCFDPISYGDNDLAYTTVIMLVAVLFLEPWVGLLRFSYDENDLTGRRRVFTNTMVLSGICLPVYVIGCVICSRIFQLPNVVWMILFGCSYLFLNIFQFKIRADGYNIDFLISGMISAVMQLIIALAAIYVFHAGAVTIFLSPIGGNAAACLYVCIRHSYFAEFRSSLIDKGYIRHLFLFSYPLAINSAAFWGMTNVNRYFARYYLGTEINGYIALATKFTNIVAQLVSVFALAWQESAFEQSSSSERARYYSDMFKNYYLLMALGSSGIMLMTNLLFTTFISRTYLPTRATLPLYYTSAFLNAISNFYGHLFSAEKRTGILLSSTIFGTITNIGMLMLTVNRLGIYSVPISLSLGYLVNVILRILRYQKINKLDLNFKNLIIGGAFVGASMIICYHDNTWIGICFTILTGAFTLYAFRDLFCSLINTIRKKC